MATDRETRQLYTLLLRVFAEQRHGNESVTLGMLERGGWQSDRALTLMQWAMGYGLAHGTTEGGQRAYYLDDSLRGLDFGEYAKTVKERLNIS